MARAWELDEPAGNRQSWIIGAALLLALAAVAGGAYLVMASRPWKAAASAVPAVTPVSAATVGAADVPVYVDALATVTPLRTVTLQAQVSGVLTAVDFKEGQAVHAGQVIATIDQRALRAQLLQAQGMLARDQAGLDNARLELARFQGLIKAGSITQQTLDAQLALVKQGAGSVMADEGGVANLQVQLDDTTIRSPIAGTVGLRLVDAGNYVAAGASPGIAVITQSAPVTLVFSIPEDDLAQVHKALAAGPVTVDAFDRSKTALLARGHLLALDNQVDTVNRTVRVKALFVKDAPNLIPNQRVEARMQVDTLKQVPVVPTQAIQHGAKGDFVFVADATGKAQLRNIQSGPIDGDSTAVINAAVKPGEVVVTAGAGKLDQGAPLRIVSR
jgi:multidrug efflux system membrane fusion protein